MVANKHVIFGIHVLHRMKDATSVQSLLSEYGCYIKTRIGLHEVSGEYCAPNGVILLEMFGEEAICYEFKAKLEAMDGLEVKEMVFAH